MSIPQPQRDEKGRVVGEFYPLQREELIALHKSKLINNAGYVHLALRYENPFCDRPIEVFPKEFALRWQMAESSVYAAIAALKEAKAIEIKHGKIVIEFKTETATTLDTKGYSQQDSQQENSDSQQEGLSRNLEFSQPCKSKVSRIQEKILDSYKELPIVRKDSQILENSDIYRSRARSDSKDISNPPDRSGEGGKNAYEEPERSQSKPASLTSKPEELTRQVETSSEDKSSAAACNDLLQVLDSLGVLRKAQALLNKMEELEIKPCQGYSAERIAGVIKECHLSQLWGALRHIEETWESIRNPTAIFCSKAPKMPIEVEHRLPEFDRAAHDEKMAQATTPEASKAYIEKIKSEKIKAIASSSGDKRLRKFADLIPSMPSSKPNTDFDTDYAAEQRRLARQMMEDSGDAAT